MSCFDPFVSAFGTTFLDLLLILVLMRKKFYNGYIQSLMEVRISMKWTFEEDCIICSFCEEHEGMTISDAFLHEAAYISASNKSFAKSANTSARSSTCSANSFDTKSRGNRSMK